MAVTHNYICKHCGLLKPITEYPEDEDRRYAWCFECLEAEGRKVTSPPEKERGGGVVKVNYSSLRPDYNEDWWRV